MSRNLGRRDCYYCGDTPLPVGDKHPITRDEAGARFKEHEGMVVVWAQCPSCEAKYLAWVKAPERWATPPWVSEDGEEFFDLSFRSTFDDEPGVGDLPSYKVELRRVRIGPWEEEAAMEWIDNSDSRKPPVGVEVEVKTSEDHVLRTQWLGRYWACDGNGIFSVMAWRHIADVAPSTVDHPPHYTTGKIEAIDFIEDQKLGFHDGNVVKYVARARHKGSELEDLKKAEWYLRRRIEQIEGGGK